VEKDRLWGILVFSFSKEVVEKVKLPPLFIKIDDKILFKN